MSVWLGFFFPASLYWISSRAYTRVYARACNCRGRSSVSLSSSLGLASPRVAPCRVGPAKHARLTACENTISHEWVMIPIRGFAYRFIMRRWNWKLERNVAQQNRALHVERRRRAAAETINQRLLPRVSLSPSLPPLRLSLFANRMQIALTLMANDATVQGKKGGASHPKNFPRARLFLHMRLSLRMCEFARRRPCAQMY